MRTLAVMHLAEITGPARSLYPRLAALGERGHLETIVPGDGAVATLYSEIGAVTICRYSPLRLPASARGLTGVALGLAHDFSTLRARVRMSRADLVVVVTSVLPAALLAARLERVPAIAYVAEIFEKPLGRRHLRAALRRPLLEYTRSSASAVVCCSDAVSRQFGSKRGGVFTIHPGIAASSPTSEPRDARLRLGVPETALCLAVVGSISEGRGQDVLVRALPRIVQSHPDVRCLVAGLPHPLAVDYAYRSSIDRLASDLGVREHLVFPGFVDPIDDVYSASDIVVNPARFNEPFGRVALEALAAGRPVVAARVGAIPEILTHERNALLVERDDPAEIARAVLRLSSDKGLRDRLVTAGQELVRESYTEAAGVKSFNSVVDAVLAGRRR